jgi:hypothetical protein
MPAVVLIASRSILLAGRVAPKLKEIGKPVGPAVVGASLALVLVSGWVASREIREMQCTYREPIVFLERHGSKHVSLPYPVTKTYLGVENVKTPPATWEELEEYYRQGYRYYVIDFRKFFIKPPFGDTGKGKIIEEIESTLEPVFACTNPCYTSPGYLFELNIFFRLTRRLVREAEALGIDQIRIYDLEDCFGKKDA